MEGKEILVSEPYGERIDAAALIQLESFCRAFGLAYRLSTNSYHYPGRTLMVMIWQ